MKQSGLLELNYKDLLKGLLVFVLTSVITAVQQMLTNVPPTFDLKEIGVVALKAIFAYLTLQLATNNVGSLFSRDEEIGGGGIKNPTKP